MSESNIMMVNPNEIVIDMPVDEQNVLQKMESMRERGIIQPVTLWLQGMRVIDGFHRSVAAQRLGWNEIPCYVVDCNEDAFWDARIQSARQHHRIENERLRSWMIESWKSTQWYKPDSVSDDLLEKYHKSPEFLSLAENLWRVFRKSLDSKRIEFNGGSGQTITNYTWKDGTDQSLVDWVKQKSQRWGIDLDSLVEIILLSVGVNSRYPASYTADELAKKFDLTLDERITAEHGLRSLKHADIAEEKPIIESWVKEKVIGSKAPFAPGLSYGDHRKEHWKHQSELLRQQSLKDSSERSRYEQTPQGQAEVHKRKVQTVKEAMDRVVWAAESVDHLISDSQEFSLPVAEAIATLTDFHNEHFKRKDTKIKDLVTARNAQLRREIKALTEKVESLERALNTKQAVTPRLKNVMVEHAQ